MVTSGRVMKTLSFANAFMLDEPVADIDTGPCKLKKNKMWFYVNMLLVYCMPQYCSGLKSSHENQPELEKDLSVLAFKYGKAIHFNSYLLSLTLNKCNLLRGNRIVTFAEASNTQHRLSCCSRIPNQLMCNTAYCWRALGC